MHPEKSPQYLKKCPIATPQRVLREREIGQMHHLRYLSNCDTSHLAGKSAADEFFQKSAMGKNSRAARGQCGLSKLRRKPKKSLASR